MKKLAGEQALVIATMRKMRGMTERTACKHLRARRFGICYYPKSEDPVDIVIRSELHRLSGKHRRLRMTWHLNQMGFQINHRRVERL